MSDTPLHFLTIAELGRRLRRGELSPIELTERLLERVESLDARLNAFRVVCAERALAQAEAAQTLLRAGVDLGPLHGIPYAAKDLFDVAGLPTTAGCSLLRDNIASTSAHVIRRLEEAGAVLLGKTNTVQFAYGGAGVNHDHGTPHNPWQEKHHVAGGSSSGSAVAVAAGLAPMALGSDTGGSVRIPAALCGITGLKTTVGQVSRAGVYPLSESLDSIGPLTRSVADAATVYDCIRGPDPDDESTSCRPAPPEATEFDGGVGGLRIAVARTPAFWEDTDTDVEQAVLGAARILEDLGARVEDIEFDEADEARKLNPRGLVIAAEAYRLNRRWLEEHYDDLDPIIATRMVQGREVAAADYLDATFAWKALRRRVNESLRDIDAVLCPTTAITARALTEVDRDMGAYNRHNVLYLRNTAIGNILDLCGVTVPCGFDNAGLPVGLMIYAKPFGEASALRVARAWEGATDWHLRVPPLALLD